MFQYSVKKGEGGGDWPSEGQRGCGVGSWGRETNRSGRGHVTYSEPGLQGIAGSARLGGTLAAGRQTLQALRSWLGLMGIPSGGMLVVVCVL